MWSIGHGACSKQGGSAGSALSIICNPSSPLRPKVDLMDDAVVDAKEVET